MKKLFVFLSIIAFAVSVSAAEKTEFLSRKDTELYMNGKPFRCVGVNKWNLFLEYAQLPTEWGETVGNPDHALASIKLASVNGFNVIRFAASGFHPKSMEGWSKPEYFEKMDEIVKCAKENRVYLVPVISWNICLFTDMGHNGLKEMMTDRDCVGRQYLELYAYQLAERYKDEPTILFWEVTNELNLGADLTFLHPYGYSVFNEPQLGTPYMRLRRDNYTAHDVGKFMKDMASFIKKHDPNHMVASGNSVPRAAAYHLMKKDGDWTRDTVEETAKYFKIVDPDPIDLISIHFYCGDAPRYDNDSEESASGLKLIKQAANTAGKPIYIGETHPGKAGLKNYKPNDPFMESLFKEAIDNDYSMILMWVWDVPGNEADVTPATMPQLVERMKDVDKKMKEKAKK
ncbi:MAG: cellulase family glycosylhydrolase [Abditibacteriota bacterium]|nr:cellulase family glycosylhydrolase [Abditibacteriota bacterium]